ncbi:uncharacterized protein LOC128641310 isoform X2 [Bombina bombina]|uniref:uncharacterized protein LOC128641310 isoform X2 n=1 Tax=Bombina bombina TaxID=8345 RepID=UPI00235A53C1|nr:uncharacterized protein LOC128641310 isoform X2 [Bombina bombina]
MNADNISASSLITITDLKECYICRDEDVLYREELCHYCDCKDLVVHQRCLLIWIQQGSGNEDRQRCKVCTAKFHLQEGSVWRALLCHWQNVLLLALLVGFMMLIPFIVHQIIILEDLSPDNLFRTAAACFGIIAEIFLVKCFIWYCSDQYRKARMASYSIKARTERENERVSLHWSDDRNSSASAENNTEEDSHKAMSTKGTASPKLPV